MSVKAVIFDLDGTLLDTEKYQYMGWVEPLRDLGIEFSKQEYTKYSGKGREQIESELIDKYNLSIKKGALVEKKTLLLKEWLSEKEISFMPHAREAVDFFRSKCEKLAICTGGDKEEVIKKLNKIGILRLFDVIVSGSDVTKPKPSPEIYLKTIEKLDIRPEEAIVFEDTREGMNSAKDAGLKCFVIPNVFSINHDFSRADGVFSSFKEAMEELRQM